MSEAQEVKTDPAAELKAMESVSQALSGLQPNAKERVLRWAAEVHEVKLLNVPAVKPQKSQAEPKGLERDSEELEQRQFKDVAEFFHMARPSTEDERALVVAYWFQQHEGKESWGSQLVQNQLKHIGEPVSNITKSFTRLKDQRPALVIQLEKSGSSRQGRKTYKVTHSGITYVKSMLSRITEE
ncbi:MAG TPA: hypothetical protein VEK08_13350 [Planctomycetota bacterium]|nr:hypothetical protein [Planctomycetota bacterium]